MDPLSLACTQEIAHLRKKKQLLYVDATIHLGLMQQCSASIASTFVHVNFHLTLLALRRLHIEHKKVDKKKKKKDKKWISLCI